MHFVKNPLNPEQHLTLGAWLQASATELTRAWRSAGFVDAPEHPQALLDGIVENLLVELGRGLDRPEEATGEAWQRARGVLRHSPERGLKALATEFRRLALTLDGLARTAGATDLERVRLRQHLVAAHAQAVAEVQEGESHGGRVVVELFEQRGFERARRHHAA